MILMIINNSSNVCVCVCVLYESAYAMHERLSTDRNHLQ